MLYSLWVRLVIVLKKALPNVLKKPFKDNIDSIMTIWVYNYPPGARWVLFQQDVEIKANMTKQKKTS